MQHQQRKASYLRQDIHEVNKSFIYKDLKQLPDNKYHGLIVAIDKIWDCMV